MTRREIRMNDDGRPATRRAAFQISIGLLACVLSGAWQPAQAGPATPGAAPAAGGAELEEIVVTAEKRESTVQATPISITAVSSEELATQNVVTIEDLTGA